ncbi:hypothetical protein EV359DRAFT_66633 [Lentinula novae-zelandiae]|nr:hypothetical protein EV359DRAFT_66633 [Lentinula novae-zelandiae]
MLCTYAKSLLVRNDSWKNLVVESKNQEGGWSTQLRSFGSRGIASSLVVVRIGLGIDALATLQTYPVRETGDVENQALGGVTTKNLEQCNNDGSRRSESIRPFQLKYYAAGHPENQASGSM